MYLEKYDDKSKEYKKIRAFFSGKSEYKKTPHLHIKCDTFRT